MTSQANGYRVLTAAQCATLTAIQDELVPREGDRPSAGEAGGAAAVDSYLHARPTLRTDVLTVLDAVTAAAQSRADGQSGSASPMSPFVALPAVAQVAVLRAVEAEHPDPFRTLVELTYTAYYTNPAIQARLGPDGQLPQPRGYPAPSPFDPRRLERVRRRSRLWRDA